MTALWVAGVVGLALGGYLGFRGVARKDLDDVSFGLGLLVLGALSLVLAVAGYGALGSPVVPVLGSLPPLILSLGTVHAVTPRYWRWYLIFVVIGVIVAATFRQAVVAFHSVAGLILLVLPIYAVARKAAPPYFALVSVGALLIGIGGVALATIAAGRPLLPLDLVLTILPYVLLGTIVFVGAGALLRRK
ncbi:hypothetical protein [Infirmifilum lucidum]|uniref:hypothetical protein n=1 Tax=Infirmifilum lucidum TaxID=2776706 RepID=UPI001CEDCBB2|nr:hypothetical protein [Infirmifilum lucidum]